MRTKSATINASTSGDNSIVAAVAGRKIEVLGYTLVASGAVNVKWRSATNDLTGAMNLATNGGIAIAATDKAIMKANLGEALQINLSGAVGVAGRVTYREVLP